MSGWPSAVEYVSAVQNPPICFDDSDLKGGQPKLTSLGLPVCASGNFATVFRMENGAATFAARCFTRPVVADQQQRYAEISKYFSGVSLGALVAFEYLIKGIQIAGQWYPLLKMQWVKGKRLDTEVESRVGNPKGLEDLATEWRSLMKDLRANHISHCDLSHGNVMYNGGYLLIDYDGSWVSALAGTNSGENGHPNFQHPERVSAGYYEENTDSFAALVIYLSLLALRSDSSLWPTYSNGDNLIFTAADFKAPGTTPIWARLKVSPDAEVVRLTEELQKFCGWPVSSVPDLETILTQQPYPQPATPYTPSTPRPRAAPPPRPRTPTMPIPVAPAPRPVTTPLPPPLRPAMAQLATCPNCGTASRAGSKFCAKCGYSVVTTTCPHCAQTTAVRTFCAHCGQRL
ncbi:MAG: zinc ribbon domain-containing protein [bacterium]|nr:zinc ribbon domain-containing protein [bacterium]